MNAESRLRSYALFAHLIIFWYSLLLVLLSAFQTVLQSRWGVEIASAAGIFLSVFVFALSLLLYGFRLEEKANLHRDCYLKLQSLYSSSECVLDKNSKYLEILSQYPNHSERDYKRVIIEHWLRGDKIYNSSGPLSPSYYDVILSTLALVCYPLGLAIAFAWPLVLLIALW